MTGAVSEAHAHCADLVRRGDPDRALAALFAPEPRRRALFAFAAAAWEVARTRETVSEPLLGRIRLQWWRETVDGACSGTPRAQPVALALADVVDAVGAEAVRARFGRLIDARERDLDDAPFETFAALEAYAAATAGELIGLWMDALGWRGADADATATALGKAWGLAGLARAIPFHAQARRSYLPADLAVDAGVTEAALFDGKPGPGLALVVRAMADRARDLLAEARRVGASAPPAARAALLHATLAEARLKQLERNGFDPFRGDPEPPPLARPLRVLWSGVTGRW